MKVPVFSLEGSRIGEVELPEVFQEEYRPDLIKRAVISSQTARLQPKGVDPMAGKRTTAETWGKGYGVARVRRVKGRGSPASGTGAFSPHTVGGRRAHPPLPWKILKERINKKEKKLAFRSAVAATARVELVRSRGHLVEKIPSLPLVVEDKLEELSETKRVKEVFQKLGLWEEVERVSEREKIRAGRGKMRGRKYRRPVGPLLVISGDKGIKKGAGNLPGVEVVEVRNLGVEDLAPGGMPARLTVWTTSALEKLEERV
ncbi:MAG: 50S ribosomal protein L4 [Hadesarchaea archaeon]|nr:MAG: 50S ribosomal protein L4 [Hadesarchaea archaeon]